MRLEVTSGSDPTFSGWLFPALLPKSNFFVSHKCAHQSFKSTQHASPTCQIMYMNSPSMITTTSALITNPLSYDKECEKKRKSGPNTYQVRDAKQTLKGIWHPSSPSTTGVIIPLFTRLIFVLSSSENSKFDTSVTKSVWSSITLSRKWIGCPLSNLQEQLTPFAIQYNFSRHQRTIT
jgi:hypothetical protein